MKPENKIINILKKNLERGLTITELVKISKLTRSAIRTILARLEGAGEVSIRKVGIAKVYSLKRRKK
ncbi:MAG: hypothetical protein KJ767_04110 [Nanoarchaeota archaeon]|nr:hypothetical protein [Nanoarchaeota archaeon]